MLDDEIQEKRLQTVLRHIENVRDDCLLLGNRLIKQGKDGLGRMLIANGLIHDNSKLRGIEWEYLHPDVKETNPAAFLIAHKQHITSLSNQHHPEAWPCGINEMAPVYLAEMVCDWKARSNEFGTDLWEWIKDVAVDKYKISTSGKTYKQIKEFVDLLLERKFK